MSAPHALIREARRLDGEARGHKGEIARHRRALQDVRAKQAALERQCAALGIAVVYAPTPLLSTGEGTLHGRSDPRPLDADR